MLIFNLIGLAELVVAIIVGGVLRQQFGSDDPYAPSPMIWMAFALVPVDLAYRFLRVRPRLPKGWLADKAGGSLMLLPAWFTGIVAGVLIYFFG